MSWKQPIPTGLESVFGNDHAACLLYRELIYRAANADTVFVDERGKRASLKRGQVVFGRNMFAKYLCMEPYRVYRLLSDLETTYGLLHKQTNRNYTIVELLNYDDLVDIAQATPILHKQRTSKRTSNAQANAQANKSDNDQEMHKQISESAQADFAKVHTSKQELKGNISITTPLPPSQGDGESKQPTCTDKERDYVIRLWKEATGRTLRTKLTENVNACKRIKSLINDEQEFRNVLTYVRMLQADQHGNTALKIALVNFVGLEKNLEKIETYGQGVQERGKFKSASSTSTLATIPGKRT